jgi:putative MATE family efflux protein
MRRRRSSVSSPRSRPSSGRWGEQDRLILRLALPALGALAAEPLFLLADSAIVGHLGAAPLAGLGVAGAALSAVVNMCVFLAYGTTGSVARLLGAGDRRGAIQQGVNGMWLALALGLVLAAALLPAAPALVRILHAPPAAVPYAVTYLRISAAGVPPMLLVLAGTGILRGLHAVRAPLVVAVTGFAANTALNYLLVFPAGLGVAGSALGTVLAQAGMAVAYVAVAARAVRSSGARARPDLAAIRAAGGASAALFLRTVALRIYLLASVWVAGRYGTVAVAAHTLASNVWNLLALMLDALAIAAQALIARGLGAGDVAAVRALLRRLLGWSAAAGLAGGALVLASIPVLVPVLVTDPDVRALTATVLLLVALFQPLNGAVFLLDGVLIGAGDGRYLALAGLVTTAVFLAAAAAGLALAGGTGGGLVTLWWAIGLYMAARLAALGLRIRTGAWIVTGAVR